MPTIGEMVAAWGLQIDLSQIQMDAMTRHITSTVNTEREACAKICDKWAKEITEGLEYTPLGAVEDIATEIRER